MISKINKYISVGLMVCGVAAAITACTDKWDEHYNSLGSGEVHEGTLWQAIKADKNLSNFALVIESCDFAKSLNGSQMFTVFAPTNDSFTETEAKALIADYKTQQNAGVTEDDNTVYKEFIQNHVALYNYSVSENTNDSIVLMNGKYAVLKSDNIDGVSFQTKNQLYSNGVLFVVKNKVSYMTNVFEYLRKDAELDSLRKFLYSGDLLLSGRTYPRFYYKEFQPTLSVAGSIVNGKTQYLDSVFRQENELFDYLGILNSEDSSYTMVAPTNELWDSLQAEYSSYFNYPSRVSKRDSMIYTNTGLAILRGTTFSSTFNSEEALQDSALSVNALKNYTYRVAAWGLPFEYYQYYMPKGAKGVLNQNASDIVSCSNGKIQKARKDTWNINKLNTFNQYIIVEAEGRNAIKDMRKVKEKDDSVATVTPVTRYVTSDIKNYYGKVWSNSFVEFEPNKTSVDHWVTFRLPNVLSNVGYDIYLVTVPALANDSNATTQARLPVKLKCSIFCPDSGSEEIIDPETGKAKEFVTRVDTIDYLLLAEDYKFGHSTYDLDDEKMQATLTVETKVTNRQNNNQYQRTMRIDCILLVPHGQFHVVDALPSNPSIDTRYAGQPGLIMLPHGGSYDPTNQTFYNDRPFKWWYMLR